MKLKKIKRLGAGVLLFVFVFSSTSVFADPAIWVDPSTGRITVKATREQMKKIEEMLPQFPTQTRQIQIEAKIVEVSSTVTEKFGAFLERLTGLEVPVTGETGAGGAISYGAGSLEELEQGLGVLTIDFYRLTREERFEVILNALLSRGKARILSSPRVVTMSGEVAGIYVTTEVPYLSSITYRVVNGEEIPEKHYSYATVGIILQVLPRIVGEDLVEMSIIPLVGNYEITPEFGAENPIFKRQVSPTNVTIKDGESLVIGGLISREKTKTTLGLPIISHLPILGNLFKNQIDIVKEKNLLITIKPHILKPKEIKGRIKKIFHFKYAVASEIEPQIRKILSPDGSIEVNPKEALPNSILVRDREDKMKIIQSLLNEIGSYEAQRRQAVYHLVYTPVQEAKEAIADFLSNRGFVKIKEGNTLIVEDGAYQVSMIDKVISTLEEYNAVPREKLFQLSYLPTSLAVEEIRSLLSPRGSVEVVKEGTILVKDGNWIIKKIEKKLQEIDSFEKQKETKVYSLKYVVVSELIKQASFERELKTKLSSQAQVKVREEKNELVITELRWKQEEIEKLIKKFDQYNPVEFIYVAQFVPASSLKLQVSSLLSPQGQISVDTAKNSLIIKDSPYHVKRIKEKLYTLDVSFQKKRQKRITVTYIPLEKAIEIVREELSDKGEVILVEEDKRSFIIEDIPSVLSKIERRLAELDTFEKQKVAKFYKLKYISSKDAARVIRYFLSPKGKVYTEGYELLVIDAPYYQNIIERIINLINVPPKFSQLQYFKKILQQGG